MYFFFLMYITFSLPCTHRVLSPLHTQALSVLKIAFDIIKPLIFKEKLVLHRIGIFLIVENIILFSIRCTNIFCHLHTFAVSAHCFLAVIFLV